MIIWVAKWWIVFIKHHHSSDQRGEWSHQNGDVRCQKKMFEFNNIGILRSQIWGVNMEI